MTNLVRFNISRFEGRFVAQMFVAQKVDGFSFGTCGMQGYNLGRFATKDEAKACIEAKKATLRKAA